MNANQLHTWFLRLRTGSPDRKLTFVLGLIRHQPTARTCQVIAMAGD